MLRKQVINIVTKNKRYRHPYDEDTKAFKSNAGNQFEVEEKLVIDDEGLWSLEKVGVIDQQAMIDSHRESTDLKSMIERYKNNGDTSGLASRSGVFLDITGAPDNLASYYQIIADAEAEFMSQPLSVREQFGHNPVLYFNDVIARAKATAVAEPVTPAVEPKGADAE